MKRLLIACTSFLAMSALLASCKKIDDITNPNTNPTSTPSPSTPTPSNVDGAFVSVKVKYAYYANGISIPFDFQTAVGGAFTSTGSNTYTDAGSVSVNSHGLEKQSNNVYTKTALIGQTPATLDFDNGSSWSIGGAGSVAGFTYDHNQSFPSFSGSVPTSVSKSSGLTINIASNVSNADSVIVLIAAGSSSLTKTVSASATSVTFTSGELSGFPTVSDNTAIVQVDPYRYIVVNKNGKNYAFVKELATIAMVNIN